MQPDGMVVAAVLAGDRLLEIGLRLGKLGLVADLLSTEVQVGYMNGLDVTDVERTRVPNRSPTNRGPP